MEMEHRLRTTGLDRLCGELYRISIYEPKIVLVLITYVAL